MNEILKVIWRKRPKGKSGGLCPSCRLPFRVMVNRKSQNKKEWNVYQHEWVEITVKSEIGPLTEIVNLNQCWQEKRSWTK